MKKVISAALAALCMMTVPAMTAQGKWFQNNYWEVIGDTRGFCNASSLYPGKGVALTLGITADRRVKLFLSGTNAVKGATYENMFSTGPSAGLFTGYAIESGLIEYTITPQALIKLAYAKTLNVQNLGTFEMKGSMEAISELMKCQQAMTGKDA